MSLPNLIKETVGGVIGAVPPNAVDDAALAGTNYWHRLWLTLYYYARQPAGQFHRPADFPDRWPSCFTSGAATGGR